MDMSQLAALMLEYEQVQRKADAMKAEIEAAVLEIGKTQTVGNVRASYSGGRKSYNYEAAARDVPPALIEANTKTRVSIDWRQVCVDAEIPKDLIPFTQSAPSVSVKLV